MIKILIFISLLWVLGCASSPQKKSPAMEPAGIGSVSTNQDQSQSSESGDSEANGGDQTTKNASAPMTNQAPNSDLYRKFNQARASKQTRAAQEAAGELLARNPGDPNVLNALSSMYIDQEKYDLARLLISKVLEKNPANSTAFNNLGVIELKTGNLRLALVNFKKSTEADSGNKFAHANLGSIYLQYRNYQNAAQELQAAVDHGDQSTATLSNFGYALAGVGRLDDSAGYYEKAMAKDSDNVIVMLNYAALLIERMGKTEKGVKLLNKIRFVAREPAILEKIDLLAKTAESPKKTGQEKGSQEKESPIETPVE